MLADKQHNSFFCSFWIFFKRFNKNIFAVVEKVQYAIPCQHIIILQDILFPILFNLIYLKIYSNETFVKLKTICSGRRIHFSVFVFGSSLKRNIQIESLLRIKTSEFLVEGCVSKKARHGCQLTKPKSKSQRNNLLQVPIERPNYAPLNSIRYLS